MYILIYGAVILFFIAMIFPMSTSLFAAFGVIFAVIAVIAIAKRNFEISKTKINIYPEDALIIQNVKAGGVIKLSNVDGYNEDLDLKVIARNLYMEGDYSWYELECVRNDGEKVWVDIDDDDELVVSVVLEKVKLSEIKTSAPYESMYENESGSVIFRGVNYWYKDSGDAVFYKHCDDKHKEKLKYWDFKNSSSNHLISVEKWNNENGKTDNLAYYSQIIKPSFITVYSTCSEGNK